MKRRIIALLTVIAALLSLTVSCGGGGEGGEGSGEWTLPDIAATTNSSGEEYMSISEAAIVTGSNVKVTLTVKLGGEVGDDVKLLVWDSAQSNYTESTADYTVSIDGENGSIDNAEDGKIATFTTQVIEPKMFRDLYYARAVATAENGDTVYSNAYRYSIYEIANAHFDKAEEDENADQLLGFTYSSLLKRGAMAQKSQDYKKDKLATDTAYFIELEDACFDDGFNSGYYSDGEVLTLHPASTRGSFSHWENADEDIISKDSIYTLTVSEEMDKSRLLARFYEENELRYTAKILQTKTGAAAITAMIHDDGSLTSAALLDELYEEYGIVGDVALLASRVYNPKTETLNESALQSWREYMATGRWKIVSHSMTHTWWGTATEITDENGEVTGYEFADNEPKVYDEIVNSQKILRELFPGERVLTFAYPGFSAEKTKYASGENSHLVKEVIYSPASVELIKETYISARYTSGVKGYVNGEMDLYWFDGGFVSETSINERVDGILTTAVEKGGIQVFSFHVVSSDGTSDGGSTCPVEYMEKLVKMIADKVEAGEVWHTHYEDAILYVTERNNATLTVSGDESALHYDLTDTLDDEIYNYPLTVRAKLPAEWTRVKLTQGDRVDYYDTKDIGGWNCADISIIPDGGTATLTPCDDAASTLNGADGAQAALPCGKDEN